MQTWLSVGFDLLPQAFLFCKDELIQSDIPGNVVDNDFFFFSATTLLRASLTYTTVELVDRNFNEISLNVGWLS